MGSAAGRDKLQKCVVRSRDDNFCIRTRIEAYDTRKSIYTKNYTYDKPTSSVTDKLDLRNSAWKMEISAV